MIDPSRRTMLAVAALVCAAPAAPALAQGTPPRAGRDYRLVQPPQPTDAPPGKVEVIEFFWYGCPHCNALEPLLQDWVRKLPDDVVFRRVHVPFGDRRHQQLFYTLESMGKADALNARVFHAIHVEHDRLDTLEKMTAFASRNGLDPKAFKDTYESFAVRTKMRRAAQLTEAYGVEGVPAMGVAGKYYTAPSMVGSSEGAFRVLDYLISVERKAGK